MYQKIKWELESVVISGKWCEVFYICRITICTYDNIIPEPQDLLVPNK